ncbi:MAG: hypothetical protein ACFFG0_26995 [Candidatus Thorarchaeota archaeon]
MCFQNFPKTVLAPLLVASIAYFLFGKLDELKKRKSYSKLGAIIIHSLIEEVKNGRDSIRNILDPKNNSRPVRLPRKSWNGINTISDEVMLRIIELSKRNKDIGFPSVQIRIHTKNYFDHMVTNWDNVVDQANKRNDYKAFAMKAFPKYDEAATSVLDMLENVKSMLENNSRKLIPK